MIVFCPLVQVPAPLHASCFIICPLQVYAVPGQPVTAVVLAGAFVQLVVPATQ